MSRDSDIYGVNTLPIIVPPGATLAVLREGAAGQAATLLKWYSGGSISIIGCTVGSTLTAAELVSAGNSGGYILGTAEALSVDGPTRFYLMATGTTATVMQIRGLTSGF